MEQFHTNSRREFLRQMRAAAATAAATSVPFSSFLSACGPSVTIPSSADTVILLWMAGGMAHTETFDPKAYAPYEKRDRKQTSA